jgi:high-affinity iron transporter
VQGLLSKWGKCVLTVFLILLREGLEAALVVGIVVGYLIKVGRRDALRWVWIGIVTALLVSLGIGILVFITIGDLPSTIQEPIEGIAAVFAVGVLTWMLFWMRRQGRALKGELEGQLDAALQAGSTAALVGLAFVAIVREGLETALFLLALFRSAAATGQLSPELPIAGLAGLAVAVLLGAAIVGGAIRLNLRRFFSVTGVVILFVAAGLVASAIGAFVDAGWLPTGAPALNLSGLLPETSPIGALLAGMFGYRAQPTVLQLVGYFGYLVPVLALFLAGDRLRLFRRPRFA